MQCPAAASALVPGPPPHLGREWHRSPQHGKMPEDRRKMPQTPAAQQVEDGIQVNTSECGRRPGVRGR